MIDLFSLEFWTGIGFIIDFILVVLLLKVSRRAAHQSSDSIPNGGYPVTDSSETNDESARAAREILALLEPLVQDSKNAALSFDAQITEKKRLIKQLNDALDNRIININLLLSRAESLQNKIESRIQSNLREDRDLSSRCPSLPSSSSDDLNDQQTRIIELHDQGTDINTIAASLGLPKGEVRLVIDLKTKFQAMAQQVE